MSTKLVPLSLMATLMSSTALAEVPNVVADIAPVHSLVARVMDGVGTPNLLVQQGASPHSYSLRPSEAGALQEADLVFWMGEDLAPWMEDAVETLAANAAVTELLEADETELLDFREGALFEAHDHSDHDDHDDHDHDMDDDHDEHAHDDHDHDDHDDDDHHDHDHEDDEHDHDDHVHDDDQDDHEDHDHDHDEHADEEHDEDGHDDHAHDDHDDDDHHGHDHGDHDPHAWLSPDNAAAWLNLIAAQLSAADPDNAGAYFANAAAGQAELEALSAEVNELLEHARGHSFIVFHDAYQYFEVAYDFPASGAISLGDASDPSPARIAEIQERIQEEGVDCVLAEPQFNQGLVTTVLEGTDANTGVIDPLGFELDLGPDLYPQLILAMADTLAECLDH